MKKASNNRQIICRLSVMVGILALSAFIMLGASSRLRKKVEAPIQMEYLDRGTVAVKIEDGVFLSWRLLGTEDYHSGFRIYRNGSQIGQVTNTLSILPRNTAKLPSWTILTNITKPTECGNLKPNSPKGLE